MSVVLDISSVRGRQDAPGHEETPRALLCELCEDRDHICLVDFLPVSLELGTVN